MAELTTIRRITKSGKHTFAISIPKEFIKDNNLIIGDKLEVTLKTKKIINNI